MEKEYLRPLPNKIMVDSDLTARFRQKVPETILISYKGNKYSVPDEYIGKFVDIYPEDDELFIYCGKKLIATHNISQNEVNYAPEHYINAKRKTGHGSQADIDAQSYRQLEKHEEAFKERDKIRAKLEKENDNDK